MLGSSTAGLDLTVCPFMVDSTSGHPVVGLFMTMSLPVVLGMSLLECDRVGTLLMKQNGCSFV